MNKTYRIGFIFLFSFILFSSGNLLNAQIGLRSIGVNLGYYTPSMDYWNDNALGTWSDHFSGNFYGNINAEIRIIEVLNVRVGTGYWKQKITESGIQFGDELRSDNISVQMIPVYLDLIVRSPEKMMDLFGFYGGIGGGMNFVSMEYITDIPSMGENVQNGTGKDMLFHVILGADYKIMQNFAIGAEFVYTFANYHQDVYSGADIIEQKVSIAGPQIMGTFKYIF